MHLFCCQRDANKWSSILESSLATFPSYRRNNNQTPTYFQLFTDHTPHPHENKINTFRFYPEHNENLREIWDLICFPRISWTILRNFPWRKPQTFWAPWWMSNERSLGGELCYSVSLDMLRNKMATTTYSNIWFKHHFM